MAIKDSYPEIRPSLDLNFAGSRTVDPRITFTRASTATYFDDKGRMRTALAGVPRIDFDPVTGVCNGLLIEEQRTNLLPYSEQFDNGVWSKYNTTVTANAITAPDGTITADRLVENTLNGEHFIDRTVSVTFGVTYTLSFFAKGDGSGRLFNVRTALQGNAAVAFNLSTGAGVVTSSSSLVSHGSVSVGNGWYRCWIVYTATGTGSAVFRAQLLINNNNTTYTGDGTSGIYLWGAQLEVGAFPTSYIKTEASQVTRAADNAVMTGTNFSDWYRQDEGTVYSEWMLGLDRMSVLIYSIDDQSALNGIRLRYNSAGTATDTAVTVGGAFQSVLSSTSALGLNTSHKNAMAYKSYDFARSVNGESVISSLSGMLPTVSQLRLGAWSVDLEQMNGHISRLAYYPKRLTNEQLQALTA